MGLELTTNASQHTKLTPEKKIVLPLLPNVNLQPFDHVSRAVPTICPDCKQPLHGRVFFPFAFMTVLFSVCIHMHLSFEFLQEYLWAIGTTRGGHDIQDYTSTGLNPGGKNDQLFGIITHNVRYYVSYKCVNGGGLVTTFEEQTGETFQ